MTSEQLVWLEVYKASLFSTSISNPEEQALKAVQSFKQLFPVEHTPLSTGGNKAEEQKKE